MEKCRIFLVGIGNTPNLISEEINSFLSDGKEITRVHQSSAAWCTLEGVSGVGSHITIFYKDK